MIQPLLEGPDRFGSKLSPFEISFVMDLKESGKKRSCFSGSGDNRVLRLKSDLGRPRVTQRAALETRHHRAKRLSAGLTFLQMMFFRAICMSHRLKTKTFVD